MPPITTEAIMVSNHTSSDLYSVGAPVHTSHPTNPAIEPAHPPVARRQREDIAVLFSCPLCSRCRIDLYRLAEKPDSFVICPQGTLCGCDICGGAYVS